MIDLSKKDNDFFFFQRLDFENALDTIIDLCKNRLPKAYNYCPIEDIVITSYSIHYTKLYEMLKMSLDL